MSKRNFTEFGINMNLSRMMMYQQAYFNEEYFNSYFDRNNPSHIYFIGKRPKITIEPNNFKVTKEHLVLPFKIQKKEEYIDFPIKRNNPFGHTNVNLDSTYPYSEFLLYENGKVKIEGLASVYLQELSRSMEPIQYLDFEVLYIGQSYGKDGNRQSPDRLKSHSTLQGIYAEAMINNDQRQLFFPADDNYNSRLKFVNAPWFYYFSHRIILLVVTCSSISKELTFKYSCYCWD